MTAFLLTLDSGDPFDVFDHTDTGTICRMNVSHATAERLRMFIDKTGELVNSKGDRVHGVRLLTSKPDFKLAALSPTIPGGGEVTAELLP